MQIEGKEVVYVKDVIVIIQDKLRQASRAAQKVLPGRRAGINLPLDEASTLLKSVEEVMERSGMDKKLGFVRSFEKNSFVNNAHVEPAHETLVGGDHHYGGAPVFRV